MKSFVALFLGFLLLAKCQPAMAQHTVADLAGRWENSDGNTGTIEFMEGSKVSVSVNGIQVPAAAYTVDFSRNPVWFDVVVAPGKTVKGLLEFEDEDTIKWQIFLNLDRGYDFSPPDDADPIFVLKRKK